MPAEQPYGAPHWLEEVQFVPEKPRQVPGTIVEFLLKIKGAQ